MQLRIVTVVLGFVFLLFAVTPIEARSDAGLEAQCRPYFGAACSERLGRWLPFAGIGDRDRPAPTSLRDHLVGGAGLAPDGVLGGDVVHHGTLVVYGAAGPPKAHVIYDARFRIALYDQGCCSWHEVVLAAGVAPPPKRVVAEELTNIGTAHGIGLGATERDVRAIYGSAPGRSLGAAGNDQLTYTTVIRFPKPYSSCEERKSFMFRDGRLTVIRIMDAC